MHILILPSEHVATTWSPLGGIFQLDLARALVAKGHQVGILSVGKFKGFKIARRSKYVPSEVIDGINVFRKYIECPLPQRFDRFLLLGKIYSRIASRMFSAYVKEFGIPDVIHAHNFLYAGLIAAYLSKRANIPFVVTEHSSEYYSSRMTGSVVARLSSVASQASGISAVSSNFAGLLADTLMLDAALVKVTPNLLPVEFRDCFDRTERQDTRSEFDLLHVAELVPIKNQAMLLEAFSIAFKGASARLHILGGGALSDALEKRAEELGVAAQVEFVGRVSRLGVREAMRSASCFVLSSHSETFGVVLIEALSQGLPVISTSCGGPADIVNDRNGILTHPGDTQGLASALRTMYENASLYDREEIMRDCRTLYGEAAVVLKYLNLYRDAVAKFPSRLAS